MCPHCLMVWLETLLGVLVGLPVLGFVFWRARNWVRRRVIKHE